VSILRLLELDQLMGNRIDEYGLIAKLVVMDQGTTEFGPRHLVAGVALGDLSIPADKTNFDGEMVHRHLQMWECEVIIRPIRRFRKHLFLEGGRIDQILTSHYEDPGSWEEEVAG
jgi:hypothetical protein